MNVCRVKLELRNFPPLRDDRDMDLNSEVQCGPDGLLGVESGKVLDLGIKV